MLDKAHEKYLFWAFQAVFLSVILYVASIFFILNPSKEKIYRCKPNKIISMPLHKFMQTLDIKYIQKHSDMSDVSEEDTDISISLWDSESLEITT